MPPESRPFRVWPTGAERFPEFDLHRFAARRSRYALFVFAVDEGRRLRDQLVRMGPHLAGVDAFLADGGSTDGSAEPAALAAAGLSGLLVKRGAGRLSAQMRMALHFALAEGYAGAVVMDGNGKDDPAAIPDFVERLQAGFDHVQGSRYVAGGRAVRTPLVRHLAVRWLHAPLVSLASRRRCTDTTNGFRAYSRRLLTDPHVRPFRDVFAAYELHYYLAIRAARLGLRTCEIPVTRSYPARGRTPTKISGVRGNLRVLRTLLAACAGRFDPAPEDRKERERVLAA